MSANAKEISFDISPQQSQILELAATKLGVTTADEAVEALVRKKLEDMARRIGKDGRGKAMYRPRLNFH